MYGLREDGSHGYTQNVRRYVPDASAPPHVQAALAEEAIEAIAHRHAPAVVTRVPYNELVAAMEAAKAEARATFAGVAVALAIALDARDQNTAGHSERVSHLAVAIGGELHLPAADIEVLRVGALLHDIGKIGVRDDVLRKAGPLTPEEFALIREHPRVGARILQPIGGLAAHLPIVELHHERMDGRGYPYGLRGNEIPLSARIVHVADAFDAMTSARAYRDACALDHAVNELRGNRGTDFDGDAVDALLEVLFRHGRQEAALRHCA